MEDFFTYDGLCTGSKGLIFIGDKTLVYRRDTNTELYPLYIDLPGGGSEVNETPFDTFQRESYEEFGLRVKKADIKYVRKYPSKLNPGKSTYFPVAKLPKEVEKEIVFGDEGLEYMILELDDFLGREDAWPVLKERALDYLQSLT